MDTPLRVAMGITGALVIGAVVLSVTTDQPVSREGYEFPDHMMMPHLADRWGWSTRDSQCSDSAHVISFRGEQRRTAQGVPLVWDLVMFGPDEYRWHRTDWPMHRYTAPIYRCKAGSASRGGN
jgi:hypothetical protein